VNGDQSDHYFMFKPQFLHNSKDHSEITSLRMIYQPWTLFASPFNLNSATYIKANASIFKFIFDVRVDTGHYNSIGDGENAALNRDYGRAGTKFGIAWSLPD